METEKAQLAAHVAAMTQELSQNSEEIRKYHAEQAVVFSRIRDLVGHLGEVVSKAHLYDLMMKSADLSSGICQPKTYTLDCVLVQVGFRA